MFMELAIGDAYGAGFEYAASSFVRERNRATDYVRNPTHPQVRPGSYTDDTQMTIAVAEVLLGHRPFTREAFADAFVRAFRRDPRAGYAGRFHDLLVTLKDGADLLARIRPYSDKSGAAMRALPLGLLPSLEEVREVTQRQARITHDTPDGVRAAEAAALMAFYFVNNLGSRQGLADYLEAILGRSWGGWKGKVGAQGWMSVRAAVTAVMGHTSLTSLLRACVDFEGDVDTVACLALGAASLSREYTHDLPAALLEGLEDGAYGRRYLVDLEASLRSRWKAGRS